MSQAATKIDYDNLPAPRGHQKHIPIETLIELHSKKLSHAQIGKVVGCSAANVTNRLKIAGITTLRDFKKNEGDILAIKGKMLLSNITNAKAKKASLSQLGVTYGIMKEKELLVRGEATQIVRYDAESLRTRYAEIKGMMHDVIDVTPDKPEIESP